jgi:uncharacterized protein YndB with AHSA1/START domain
MNYSQNIIVVEQAFALPVSPVWEAITTLDHMRRWFFSNIPAFEPIQGFSTKFDVQSESRTFRHQWRILEVVPGQKIRYHWSYEGIEGEGLVTFELINRGNGCLLRVTNEGLETFPQEIPEFSPESCRAGWTYFIKQQLKDYLL